MGEPIIALDMNATTPVDPAVRDAMLPYLSEAWGNPSSAHALGPAPKAGVKKAREQLAALLGADPHEIVFTSGGTEGDNWAIIGVQDHCALHTPARRTIVVSAVEHPAVMAPARHLERLGRAEVRVIPVGEDGRADVKAAGGLLDETVSVVSVMHANNETGVLQPVKEIAKLAHDVGAVMHTDAAQSLGKVPVDVNDLGVDLLTVAGHKLYAPKGIGALYVRAGTGIVSYLHGGGQEQGRRAGTENVPYVVGLGQAAALAQAALSRREALAGLRDRLQQKLREGLGDRLVVLGHPAHRLPNTLSCCVRGTTGAALLGACPAVCASTGSACHDGSVALSAVLAAMGVTPDVGQGALRISLGRHTTRDEVDRAAAMLLAAAQG